MSRYFIILVNFYIFLITYVKTQSLSYFLIGAMDSTSFNFKAKPINNQSGTLVISLNNQFIANVTLNSDGFYDTNITNLIPNAQYQIGIIVNGVNENLVSNMIKTFPTPDVPVSSFTFAASSNIATNSKALVYNWINLKNPQFFMLLGNVHNQDLNNGNEATYINAWVNGI